MNLLCSFGRCESGATAIEYALIVAFIGLAITASASQTGDTLEALYVRIVGIITAAI